MTKDRCGRCLRRLAAPGALAAVIAGLAASPALASTSISQSISIASSSGGASSLLSSSTMVSSTSSGSGPASTTSTANCTMPSLSQPFAPFGDTNEYALVPGLAFDSFTATGWTLSGGATITGATLSDGHTGPVLTLPTGAQAVSPPMCVQYDYPTARMIVRDASGIDGLTLKASYAGSNTQVSTSYLLTGQGSGWTPSPVLQTHPGNQSGWQLVVFTLLGSNAGPTQVYNVYVDPRMKA